MASQVQILDNAIYFLFMLMLLEKTWINILPQLWVNSRADWLFTLEMATCLGERKYWFQTSLTLLKKYFPCVTFCWWHRHWINTYSIMLSINIFNFDKYFLSIFCKGSAVSLYYQLTIWLSFDKKWLKIRWKEILVKINTKKMNDIVLSFRIFLTSNYGTSNSFNHIVIRNILWNS